MPESSSMRSTSLSRKMVPLTLNLNLHKFQAQVDQSKARFIYLMCGRQWGKSILGAWKGVKAISQPRSMVWYLNNQLKQAKDTIWSKMLQILEPCRTEFRALETNLSFNFNNGSIYSLKHAQDPDCKRGPSLKFLHIDEAQEFDGEDFITVFRPLLAAHQAPCLISGTKKPGSWFLKEWLAAEKGEIEGAAAFWFPSSSNPTIPANEWQSIKNDLERRGRLDIWENEYVCDPHGGNNAGPDIKYMEFDRRIHVCQPFKFPANFRHFVSEDWGMTDQHPTAVLWAAVSPEGIVYIYDEYLKAGYNIPTSAKTILDRTNQMGSVKIETFVLDEACWKTESDGKSAAIRFMDAGLRPAVKGIREDKAFSGASTVKAYLKPIDGEPKIQIFPNCTNLIHELETLKWSNRLGDDCTDSLRYLLGFLSTLDWKKKVNPHVVYKPFAPSFATRFKNQNEMINPDTGYLT